jgi:hypothetical protein
MTKNLKLKNFCVIPIKWKLNGVIELLDEFEVSKTNGIIKLCKEDIVEITFTAKTEKIYN